jgi:succinyl-diaminopimelate desuccinylase
MLEEILELSKKMILIKSDPDNAKALDEILDLVLSELAGFTIEKFEKDGVKSALIYNTKTRPERFKIILNGHLDVIPGKDYQYFPKIDAGKLYGVGSMDMKSNVACMVEVFKEMASKVDYPLGLQIVTDEEIGGFKGTKYQIDRGVRADFVIAGETTNFDIVNKAKGAYWLKISCKGETAHGAYTWKGENAIWKMNKFLDLLIEKHPLPTEESWASTINLAKIETANQTFNKIPDDCTISLDIRFPPEEANTILESVKRLLPQDFVMEIVAQEPPLFVEEENDFLQKLSKSVKTVTKQEPVFYGAQGSSDSRHYTRVGDKGIEFGPIGGGIGTDQEWVDISSLETFCLILKNFLTNI